MLNVSRIGIFRYDIREIMSRSEIDPALASAIIANVIAKASRISISEAKAYVNEVQQQAGFKPEVGQGICTLLDRFSTYR